MQFIDLEKQYELYQSDIQHRMDQVLAHGKFINGPEIQELEEKFAGYVHRQYAIGCASGTDALFMALLALDIGHGDEVITTPFTWISSAEVISLVGATPRFVDIQPDTFNIDPAQIEPAINSNTKAILPVDLFGQMADYERINQIAEKHNLAVIEDAAQSFGAQQNKQPARSQGDIACTSFFPAKPLGCYGDGGCCFTDDDTLAQRLRAIRNHGGEQRHHHTRVGLNGRLDTMQAAILLAKWPYFDQEITAGARIGARYNELLQDVCTVPYLKPQNTSVFAQYTIRCSDRDGLKDH